jgi:membrane-bound lytic murein transglycosylase B
LLIMHKSSLASFPSALLSMTVLSMALLLSAEPVVAGDYAERDEVQQFAQELADSSEFTVPGLLTVFRQAEYKQSIIDAISRPAEKTLKWDEYQDIFLTEKRINAGRDFIMTHQEALKQARETYGVPPVIIAAVIGVETMYGRYRGNYRVLDALTTLAFDYPPRASFFRGELKEFIRLVKEEEQAITELKGSYAGAMGYGQFIPSSYRRYSVDFDEDGVRDIWNNPVDAIGSVANYLAEHGWGRDQTVAIQVEGHKLQDELFNVSLKPSSTVGEFQALGVPIKGQANAEISPMRLVGKSGNEFWLGYKNFYVITRYNHSKLYAMAVFQLSEALKHPDTMIGQIAK